MQKHFRMCKNVYIQLNNQEKMCADGLRRVNVHQRTQQALKTGPHQTCSAHMKL